MTGFRGVIAILLMLLAHGCMSPAPIAVDARAQRLNLDRQVLRGDGFRHVIYATESAAESTGVLHVYIEGDGLPWKKRSVIAADPTSRYTLMLQLMGLDASAAIYVGRPCYLGLRFDKGCETDVWTYSRYSPAVVASMASVIEQRAANYAGIALFGHSGGGTLASLLAARLAKTRALVTIAGNMNVNGWTAHHGYTPLQGSLDPARRAALPVTVRQLHLVGERDRNTPPALMQGWIDNQVDAAVWRYADYTHVCCWVDIWPAVLRWVKRNTARKSLLLSAGQ